MKNQNVISLIEYLIEFREDYGNLINIYPWTYIFLHRNTILCYIIIDYHDDCIHDS